MKKQITKRQFLEYFHSQKYSEELTAEEMLNVWMLALMGKLDLTKENFELLCEEYDTNLKEVLKGE